MADQAEKEVFDDYDRKINERLAAKDKALGRSGNGIVGFSKSAGSWTGNRRFLWSERP